MLRRSSSVLKRIAPKLYEQRKARKLREDPLIARFPHVGKPQWMFCKLSLRQEPIQTSPSAPQRLLGADHREHPLPPSHQLPFPAHAAAGSTPSPPPPASAPTPPNPARPKLSGTPKHDQFTRPPSPLSAALADEADASSGRHLSGPSTLTHPVVSKAQYFSIRDRERRRRELEWLPDEPRSSTASRKRGFVVGLNAGKGDGDGVEVLSPTSPLSPVSPLSPRSDTPFGLPSSIANTDIDSSSSSEGEHEDDTNDSSMSPYPDAPMEVLMNPEGE